MRFLPPNSTYGEFKSALAKMAWFCHTRPDISFAVGQLEQASEKTFLVEHLRLLNDATRVIRGNTKKGITHRRLDSKTLRLVAYADGSFANNRDGSSRFGYFIMFAYSSAKCNVLSYRSFKRPHATRLVLGAEVMAFAEAFDSAFVLKKDLEDITQRSVPLAMHTNSRSLFDVITKN